MITLLAHKISNYFLKRNVIEKDNFDVYAYGFELILSSLVNAVMILTIAILCNKLFETLIFICGFIPLRVNSGGFHAKSHLECILLFLIAFIIFIISLFIIPSFILIIIVPFLLFCSIIAIFLFSPVEHINKKYSDSEKVYYKKKSRIIVLLASFIAIILLFILDIDRYAYSFTVGIFLVSFAVIISKLKFVNSAKALNKE